MSGNIFVEGEKLNFCFKSNASSLVQKLFIEPSSVFYFVRSYFFLYFQFFLLEMKERLTIILIIKDPKELLVQFILVGHIPYCFQQ